MGGQPIYVQGTVAPGATYDFNANLVAPDDTRRLSGVLADAQRPGSRLRRDDLGRHPRACGRSGNARADADACRRHHLHYHQQQHPAGPVRDQQLEHRNVKEVYYYQQGQNWQNNGVAGTGSRQECPQQTTTYYLRVVMQDNSVQTRELTVNVTPVSNAPQINSFTVNPQGQIQPGQCVTLQWNVSGSISDVLISRNNQPLWDGAPYQGTYQDCPPGSGQMTYVLKATGPGGSNQASQTITVASTQPTNTPCRSRPTRLCRSPPIRRRRSRPTRRCRSRPPSAPSRPIPDQITLGECVTLSWSFSGQSLVTAVIIRDGQPIASRHSAERFAAGLPAQRRHGHLHAARRLGGRLHPAAGPGQCGASAAAHTDAAARAAAADHQLLRRPGADRPAEHLHDADLVLHRNQHRRREPVTHRRQRQHGGAVRGRRDVTLPGLRRSRA